MLIHKISSNNSQNATIILKGLGGSGFPDYHLQNFLFSQGQELHLFDRNQDISLSLSENAITEYIDLLKEYIEKLVLQEKNIHLFGISFGAYLAMRTAQEMKEKISSIIAVAPLISPYEIFLKKSSTDENDEKKSRLITGTGLNFSLLKAILESLRDKRVKHIFQKSLVVLGENDEFEQQDFFHSLTGENLTKILISGAIHTNTLGNQQTQKEVENFFQQLN